MRTYKVTGYDVCQCPISGALHFYKKRGSYIEDGIEVSMPYLGRTSFLRTIQDYQSGVLHDIVSMPYLGRTSFLRVWQIIMGAIWRCVNALSRAHFISTSSPSERRRWSGCVNALSRAHFISTMQEKDIEIKVTSVVSMPYLGRTSFLLMELLWGILHHSSVNALSRAHFISTLYRFLYERRWTVSMPYLGRTSFLQIITDGKIVRDDFVSMPYLGRTSFLQYSEEKCGVPFYVSMPYLGRTSFLPWIGNRTKRP